MKKILFSPLKYRKTLLFFSALFFSLSALAQPANDNCSGAISLISNLNCNNAPYRLKNATASGITGGCTPAGTLYDVWFQFTAVNTTHTVTITPTDNNTNITNPRVQLFGGTCATLGTNSIVCGTTTMTSAALTIGNTYYIRVSNLNASISSKDRFDICVTHPPPSPANDNCSSATVLTSTPTPTCSSITGNLYYASNSAPTGACGGATATTTYDVWYRFVATSTTHAVTVSGLGSSLAGGTTYIQLLSGTCAAPVNISCQAVSTTGGRLTNPTPLTIGNTYFVRIYVTANPTTSSPANWNFSICLQEPPVNDQCANATLLTSGLTCVNTAGTLDLSIPLVVPVAVGCLAMGTYYDVYYSFVATAASHTVTLSGLGSGINAPRIHIFSGTCAAPVMLQCVAGTSLTEATLTIGNTYYVAVSNFTTNPSGTGGAGNFNICITNAPTPPGNDNCPGAILLTSGTSCTNTSGTLINATASAPVVPGSCGNAAAPDVWFRFVAQSAYPIIDLSSIGAPMQTNGRVQLLTGSCVSFTPVGTCFSIPASATATINTINNPGGSGLTIGQTYYIRITHNTLVAPVGAGAYTFNICIRDPAPLPIATIDYAKSYINITDGTTGGTINPGDELEIRATFVIRGAGVNIDSIAYYDTLKAGAGFVLKPGSIATRTNEGKVFRSFSDPVDTDAGFRAPFGSDTTIQINMGPSATNTSKGLLLNGNSRPTFYGNYIVMATYRVIVSAGYGTKINYGGGAFSYRDPTTGFGTKIAFPKDSLIVFQSVGICPNNVAQTNILGDEFNGTFGTAPSSAAVNQNRGTSPNTTYAYQAFNPGGPGDYFYAVANNTSSNHTTVQTTAKPGGTPPRVFGVWDISGDHTDAATDKGNKPCNPGLPISATNPCGYMLVVNAAYRTDVAFNFAVAGACPNTYYEISSWIKNICYKCSGDSTGRNASDPAGPPFYSPTVAGAAGFADSSGVMPNLAYEINGVDYYTTGNIVYQGLGIGGTQTGSDTLNKWVRKSFIYQTGPTETNFVLTVRNNAPGGGGNDWALDDISLRTCYPNMAYSSSVPLPSCVNMPLLLTDTVRCYFNTYNQYKWQRSTNGGVNWVDLAGTTATASPTLVSGMYQFVATYTVPPAFATLANNGDQYRLVVATTVANLSGGCNFSDVITITLTITNCIDIDDDNDGIPDYVEFNNPLALGDANSNTIPNWNDPLTLPWADTNADGVNDYYDWGADPNNNGVPNYLDPTFFPWIDSNADGVNDLSDKDLDGIPNQLDRDSDNDGIPDVAEAYGVDTNGDGIIDNYTDPDNDGFSQNVDSSGTGVANSGIGLGTPDFDGDGIPNYLDSDSDNDGIPDLVEAGGADTNNNGKIDISTDGDYDGIGDNYFMATALLKTGVDLIAPFGRADDWPNKNKDRDYRPNAYDLDSDADGIADVIEAGLPDLNFNGLADGVLGTNGWSTTVSGLAAINILNTDADGKPDYQDIDSDDDGIPDNIEGQSTANYKLPLLTDADGDGMTLPYDNVDNVGSIFGAMGISVYNHDGDALPDYRDLDSDADGLIDRVEGNDFNLNGVADDNVTPTGLDDDNDGLDNRFDVADSLALPTVKGTSRRMGTSGSFSGDPTPGSKTVVQRTLISQPDRDWRYSGYVLPVQFLSFTGLQSNNEVQLNWAIIADKPVDRFEIERSTDYLNYAKIKTVTDPVLLQAQQNFAATDDIAGINSTIIYYRLKVIGKAGEIQYSNVIFVRKKQDPIPISIMPNPANNYVNVNVHVEKNTHATFTLVDKVGKKMLIQDKNLRIGINNITIDLDKYSAGVYALIFETATEKTVKHLVIVK